MNQSLIDLLRAKFRYDPETGHLYLRESKRPGVDISSPIGYPNRGGYLRVAMDGKHMNAHRVAWAIYYGDWPDGDIDHINRIPNDNRIANLRLASKSENGANTAPRSECGRKGVSAYRKGFRAQIKHNGKVMYLGEFKSIDEAAHAYNKAAIQYFGEFALLNPIGQDKSQAAATAASSKGEQQ